MSYDFKAIEERWQRHWDEHATFRTEIDRSKRKFYVLDMFPYPSGSGLHVGHPEGYTATDIIARYRLMRGDNVLHPMGWDAFGLPAERHAMRTGTHPAQRTAENIANFRRQMKRLGFAYDWAREVNTTDPGYVRWTQWIFLKIWGSYYDTAQDRARPIEELPIPADIQAQGPSAARRYRDDHRLAYLHNAPVNWCPEQRVVLANEEVDEAVAAGYTVVRKPMWQWMLRITAYAERLLNDFDCVDWPRSTVLKQRNWIGRSEGAEVDFRVAGLEGDENLLRVFTTRPDTLFGATYMVMAPEHPLVATITTAAQRADVEAYIERTSHRSERDRQKSGAEAEKTGVFTGAHAINPVNGQKIPIWISDYVLMGYGTGAIMAVPGHDTRDHAFATAMNLPILEVVASGDADVDITAEAFAGEGTAVNSGFLNGLQTSAATQRMIAWLEEHGHGRGQINYRLRDWLFSRQRYWGEPFPLVHRPDGEVVAVPEDELPVTLPAMDDYNPSETGEPPLAKASAWRELPDGSLREVNTMPQWAGSCWYYLRYLDATNDHEAFSREAAEYWLPVDLYIGGSEHSTLHLLYARFWHKVLYDLGYVGTVEPFKKLVHQGLILGATYVPRDRRRNSDGSPVFFTPSDVELLADSKTWVHQQTREALDEQWDKMSKSKGNVVNPDDVVERYGADTLRLYEMFMGPLEHSAPWQPEGVGGCHRFLKRVYTMAFEGGEDGENSENGDRLRVLADGEGSERQRRLLHRTIAEVTERIERMNFNTAISSLMVLVRDLVAPEEPAPKQALQTFSQLLSPFAPHLAEELWHALGNAKSLAREPWPSFDPALLAEDTWTCVVQIKGKRRAEITVPQGADRDRVIALVMADATVQKHVGGREPRRVIYVPNRLVNIVV